MTRAASGKGAGGALGLPGSDELVIKPLVTAYFIASLTCLFLAMLAGMLFSLQFLQTYPFPGIEALSPGRWRMVHTSGVTYGFIASALLGGLHWVVPRLAKRPVLSVKLSWFMFCAWQTVVLSTTVSLLAGQAQAIEWGETPAWIDPPALVVLILMAINFLHPILKTKGPMYVTLWYFILALIWTAPLYAMGNFVPEYFVGGTAARAMTGLFTRELLGLSLTPIAWGLMYYFVPVILKKPIWSHGLSLVGFWVLAFFYPLNGIQNALHGPNPASLQVGAIISTIAVGLAIATVIINFFGTLRHRREALRGSLPIRWFFLGMVLCITACLQCALQATLTLQNIIHFTDWVVSRSHLVMFGVFGFWIFGMMTHLMPRLLNASGWYRRDWNAWHFWLTSVGMLVMFFDLVSAGLQQGFMWKNLAPWESTIVASIPFWCARTVAGVIMILGLLMFLLNVALTAIHQGPAPKRAYVPGLEPPERTGATP